MSEWCGVGLVMRIARSWRAVLAGGRILLSSRRPTAYLQRHLLLGREAAISLAFRKHGRRQECGRDFKSTIRPACRYNSVCKYKRPVIFRLARGSTSSRITYTQQSGKNSLTSAESQSIEQSERISLNGRQSAGNTRFRRLRIDGACGSK